MHMMKFKQLKNLVSFTSYEKVVDIPFAFGSKRTKPNYLTKCSLQTALQTGLLCDSGNINGWIKTKLSLVIGDNKLSSKVPSPDKKMYCRVLHKTLFLALCSS